MTRHLKSFLQLSVALLVLAGLGAAPALAQDVTFDASQTSANTTADFGKDQFQDAINAVEGTSDAIVVTNGGALNNSGTYTVSASPLNIESQSGDSLGVELDQDLNIAANEVNLDQVDLEFPGNSISLIYDDGGRVDPGSGDGGGIVFSGDGRIEGSDPTTSQGFRAGELAVTNGATLTFFSSTNNSDDANELELQGGGSPSAIAGTELRVNSGATLDLGGSVGRRGDLVFITNVQKFNTSVGNPNAFIEGTIQNGNETTIDLIDSGGANVPTEFTVAGSGDINTPLTFRTPPPTPSSFTTIFEQTLIGDFGFSTLGSTGDPGTLKFPFLETVEASLEIADAGTVRFGDVGPDDFSGESSAASIENAFEINADATFRTQKDFQLTVEGDFNQVDGTSDFRGATTVEGDADISGGSTTAGFSDDTGEQGAATFEQSFTASAGAAVTFGSPTEFNSPDGGSTVSGSTEISGANTEVEFAAPGISVPDDQPQSTVFGNFETSGGVTIQQRDEEGGSTDNGLHNIALNGNIAFDDPTLTQDGDTRIILEGDDDQALAITNANGTFQVDRLVVRNDLEREDWDGNVDQSNGELIVVELLRLEDGNFVTNGGLSISGATLIRSSTGTATGRLLSGASDLAYSSASEQPNRIEYVGSDNMATQDELLPASADSSDRAVNEFAVNLEDDTSATVTLGIDYQYSVNNRIEILKGDLAFSDQSSLALANELTFVRGDGRLITEDVAAPREAVLFPSVNTVGGDGIDLEYVNELNPITTGLEFPTVDANDSESISQNPDLVRDLTVDNEEPVNLADASTYRVNRNVEVTSGSQLQFNGQTLQMNTVEGDDNDFEVVNDGTIASADGSLLEFIGRGEADVIGDVDGSGNSPKTFTFPAVTVDKPNDDGDELRRVLFQMDNTATSEADGFEFDGDFTMTAAKNWSPSDDDGVEFESLGNDEEDVDVVQVRGNFDQQGGSFLAFDEHAGSEFTVDGDFTKNAAEDSRFYAGGSGSVDDFTVGTENNTLFQANGTFYAIVNNTFTVNGEVVNESPDKWDVDGFTSEAFEVDGADNATADITGSVTQDTTGTPLDDDGDDEVDNDEEGIFLIEGFHGEDGEVSVGDSFTNVQGDSRISDATTASVGNTVAVEDDSMSVNLGSSLNDQDQQVFEASSLTVATADGNGGSSSAAKTFHAPDAVFEASTDADVSTPGSGLPDPLGEPANPEPGAVAASDTTDFIEISGATNVQGQLALEGFELKQGGNFTLEGTGDRPWEPGLDTTYTEDESGLLGLVRFVNDGNNSRQTIETRGEYDEASSPQAPSTYFHGLAVRDTGDVELASDIVLNEASGGQGEIDETDEDGNAVTATGTLRPFGTLFLENGNLFTNTRGDYRVTVLAPEPSDGEDLVEAVSANEARNGDPVEASPVLGGSNTTKVVGTMRRALAEQNEDTGGIVTDGYIYPLGKAGQENRPRYRGLVLELPSDETEPQFFTVENIPDPNEPLPDGGITSVDANDPDSTIQLDEQSLPYYRVESDGNPNFNSFNMRVISDIGGVREVNQVRLIQRNGDWMQAGGDGAYDRNRGSDIDDDEQETTGGPNASISGFTNAVHEGVDLRDGNTIALATSSDINPNFGQFDAPGLTLASGQDAEVNAAVGEGGVDINFKLDDPDSDIPADSFNVVQSTSASSIDPDNVSFQIDMNEDAPDDVTVTFTPDTEDAEASFTDDESLLPLDQFEGSDPLTLEVEVEDEAEITDVASVGVNVDLQPGDADSDGNVGSASENAQDAQVALDEFLQGPDVDSPSELTPVAFNAADVGPDGGNGRVEPFDASLILSGDVGSGSSALAGKNQSAQDGEVVIGSVEDGTIPLTLSEDAAGIRSASIELALDASVSDVSANLPSGWIIDHATKEDGTLRVGLAGTSALSSGQQIVSIQLDGSAAKASTDLEPEGTYRLNGSDAKDVRVDIGPEEFALEGNYPNPFTQATTIPYQLSESADVTLEVYDMLGRKVGTLVDKQQSSGQYEVNVNQSKVGQSLSSGVYIYRLEAGDFQDTGKMTVVK